MRIGKDLVAAAATPVVLGILAEGESYGYAILQRISELSAVSSSGATACSIPCCTGSSDSAMSSPNGAVTGRPPAQALSPERPGASTLADHRRQWSISAACSTRSGPAAATTGSRASHSDWSEDATEQAPPSTS